jgi:hypothetical protein
VAVDGAASGPLKPAEEREEAGFALPDGPVMAMNWPSLLSDCSAKVKTLVIRGDHGDQWGFVIFRPLSQCT